MFLQADTYQPWPMVLQKKLETAALHLAEPCKALILEENISSLALFPTPTPTLLSF